MQPEERTADADTDGRVSSVPLRRVVAHAGIPHPQGKRFGGPVAHGDLRIPEGFSERGPKVQHLQPPLESQLVRNAPTRAHAQGHAAQALPRGERGAARYTALGYERELRGSQACQPFDLERGGSSTEALRAGQAEVSVAQLGAVMDFLGSLEVVPAQRNILVAGELLVVASGTARIFEFDAPIERSRRGFEPLRIPGETPRGNRGVGIAHLDGFQNWSRGQVPAGSHAERHNQDRRGRIDRMCCERRSFLHHLSPEKRAGSSLGGQVISCNPHGKSGLQLPSKYYFSVLQACPKPHCSSTPSSKRCATRA